MITFKFLKKKIALACLLGCAAAASAQTVDSFTVVNADTSADIATFTTNGSLANRPPNINVRANVTGATSVVFTDAATSHKEGAAPFAYKGNQGSAYNKWAPSNGIYVINATPYSSNGAAGPRLTLTLALGSNPTPTPTPTPTFPSAETSAVSVPLCLARVLGFRVAPRSRR